MALAVTISRSLVVFIFFLLTTPIAAITMVTFRSVMKKRNSEFRKEMEETSAKGNVDGGTLPVTKFYALEEEEIER